MNQVDIAVIKRQTGNKNGASFEYLVLEKNNGVIQFFESKKSKGDEQRFKVSYPRIALQLCGYS